MFRTPVDYWHVGYISVKHSYRPLISQWKSTMPLTLSRRRPLSYRNQSIDLQSNFTLSENIRKPNVLCCVKWRFFVVFSCYKVETLARIGLADFIKQMANQSQQLSTRLMQWICSRLIIKGLESHLHRSN